MPSVKVTSEGSFEAALKKFKRECQRSGILSDFKRKEHYDKPSVMKKKKQAAARKRARKKARPYRPR
ncbi:MAG: 30S ribosomal protein S21 [Nitrospirota bacterium]|jgi:small subunit ribosomal protein S21